MYRIVAIAILINACSSGSRSPTNVATESRCALPAPTSLIHDGAVILVRWELPANDSWYAPTLPDEPAYIAYRRTIRDAGAELEHPIADHPEPTTDEQRAIWDGEHANAELGFGGTAGRVRPVQCLDAALFAYQNARYDELAHPTEFTALVLRKDALLRVYLGASDAMFPPKSVYGLTEASADVANGWRLLVHLHNHTIQKRGDKPALGPPVPSTADVQLLRGVADELHLAQVWVTNGVFTIEVPADALARYRARGE